MTIEEYLKKRTPGLIGYEDFQKSAVLVPLLERGGATHVLFEVRSGKLAHQPGEICFPGGRMEKGETPRETAKREAVEELLLLEDQIRILGPADIFLSPANVMIYPYLGRLTGYLGSFNEEEVQEVFTVPLSFFLDHGPRQYDLKVKTVPGPDFPYEMIPKGRDYDWREGRYQVNFYEYQGRVIWGMTAKIMCSAAKLLSLGEKYGSEK